MNIEVFKPIAATAVLMLSNIIVGSVKADIKGEFDKCVFWMGVRKAFSVIVAVSLVIAAGYLVPDIQIAYISGSKMSIIEAVDVCAIGCVVTYSVKVIKNIMELLSVSVDIEEADVDVSDDPEETECDKIGCEADE